MISFMIVHIAPGSPIDRFRSGRVSPETIQNLIRLYGLDQPLPEQLFSWFTAFVVPVAPRGLGLLLHRRPAGGQQVFERIPYTLELMGTSFLDGDHLHPARHPRRGQAVQLGRQDHHGPGDDRLRHADVRLGLLLLYIFAFKLDAFPLFGRH